MAHTLSIKSIVSQSWETFKKNWKFIIPAMIITGLLGAGFNMVSSERSAILGIIGMIVSFVIGIAITLGWAQVLLKYTTGHVATTEDFISKKLQWKTYVVGYVIVIIFTSLAGSLLVVPLFGIIASGGTSIPLIVISSIIGLISLVLLVFISVRYMFLSFIAIEHPGISGWAALKKSATMTKGHIGKLIGYMLVLGLINIIGFLCLIIGLLITIPVTKLAIAYLYQQLKEKTV
jgi:uncharacterized membrane protein